MTSDLSWGESSLIAAAGVAGSFGLWVIGQADTVIPEGITTLSTAAIGSGFLIWYARHVTQVLIPQLVEKNELRVKELSDVHQKTISSLVTEFRDETKQQREDHERNISRLMSIYTADHRPADATRPANH